VNREVENFLSSFPYSESTKASYRRVLGLLTALDLDQLDAAGLIEFVERPGWGNAQQSVALFCAQKYLRWRYGELHAALSARIQRVKPKPRRSLSPDRALTVLASFNPYKASGSRDLAMIAFGLDTGLRRAELCAVKLADVNFYTNAVTVLCKGGQYGYAVFSAETAALLQAWLSFRKPADGIGSLFVNIRTGRALTGNGVACVFKRLSKRLGFQISAHDLRASFATLSTLNGAPSRVVQEAGRWSSITMVEHYTGNLQADAIRPHLPLHNL
jgi:integrase